MYELFFGLSRRPFAATPDPECCASLPTMQAAFDDLHRCLTRGDGVGILTGGAGCGKTLLCQKLVAELADAFRPVYLANSNFPTQRSLLQAILYALGRPYLRMDDQELRLELTTIIHEVASQANGVLLIVDEAHLLDEELLEEIRTATNLIHRGVPLVRVMLAGQFELEEKLASPALQSLNQRVGVHATLDQISQQESIEYIGFRLEWAGATTRTTFSSEAARMIAQASDGVPRCLNQLADHSLLLAYAAEERPVQPATVRRALEDLRHLPLQWNISESQMQSDEPDELELPPKKLPETRPERIAPTSREPEQSSVIEFGDASVIEIGGSEPQEESSVIEIGSGDVFETPSRTFESPAREIVAVEPPAIEKTRAGEKPSGGRSESKAASRKKPADKTLEVFEVASISNGRTAAVDGVGMDGRAIVKAPQPAAIKSTAQGDEVVVDRYAKLDSEYSLRIKPAPKSSDKSKSKHSQPAAKAAVRDDSKAVRASSEIGKPPATVKPSAELADELDVDTAPPAHDDLIASIERYMAELVRERPSSTVQSTNKAIDSLLTSIAPEIFSPASGEPASALPIEYDVIQPEHGETQTSGKSQDAASRGDRSAGPKSNAKKDERYARLFSDLRKRRLG